MHRPRVEIEIEELPEGSPVELVELVATDPASWRATSLVPHEGIAARLIPTRGWLPTDLGVSKTPAMVIAVGNLRAADGEAAVISARRQDALAVAVVAVDSLGASSLPRIERAFDAVMPVLVPRRADIELAFAEGLACLTSFATANTISVPVDEAYNFFVRGGQLSWARARGSEIGTMTRQVVQAIRRRKVAPKLRALLHVESTAEDHLTDLECSATALYREVKVDELLAVVSVCNETTKSVSLVVSAPGRR
jgi:hypothetical protein